MLSLEHALGQLNISASGFYQKAVTAPWPVADIAPGFAQLVVIESGDGTLAAGDDSRALAAGQIVVVTGAGPYTFVPGDAGLQLAHGMIAAKLMDGRCIFDFIAMPHSADAGRSELFKSAIPEMLHESAHPSPGSEAVVHCLLRRVVTFVLRDAWAETPVLPIARNGRQGEQLQSIVDLMTKEPAKPYTLESLSSTAGMSRTAFHKMFTETYGSSPLVILRGIRLKKAEELLKYTDMPIKAISSRLGYRSRSYFWSAFKQAYGVDPESYRSQAQ